MNNNQISYRDIKPILEAKSGDGNTTKPQKSKSKNSGDINTLKAESVNNARSLVQLLHRFEELGETSDEQLDSVISYIKGYNFKNAKDVDLTNIIIALRTVIMETEIELNVALEKLYAALYLQDKTLNERAFNYIANDSITNITNTLKKESIAKNVIKVNKKSKANEKIKESLLADNTSFNIDSEIVNLSESIIRDYGIGDINKSFGIAIELSKIYMEMTRASIETNDILFLVTQKFLYENMEPTMAKAIIQESIVYEDKDKSSAIAMLDELINETTTDDEYKFAYSNINESIKIKKTTQKSNDVKISLSAALLKVKDAPQTAASFILKTLYAKPIDDIIEDMPSIIDVLRRFFLIGGALLVNPLLAVVVGLIDHAIHQNVNEVESKKMLSHLKSQKRKYEKMLKNEKNHTKSTGYSEIITELDKQIYKVEAYNDTLLTKFQKEEADKLSESLVIEEEIGVALAIITLIENNTIDMQDIANCIQEVSAATSVYHQVKDKASSGVNKASAVDKGVSRTIDQTVDSVVEKIRTSARNDRREAIIRGQILPSTSKIVKMAAVTGIAYAINPALALIGAIGGMAISAKVNAEERKLILDEIDVELKVVDKQISQAEMNNDNKALRDLLKIQKKLEFEKKRIIYHVRTGSKL